MPLVAGMVSRQIDELSLVDEDGSMDPDDEIHGMETSDGFRT